MVAKSLCESSLAMNPPVWVPEEPTAGVDFQAGTAEAVGAVAGCSAGAEVTVLTGAVTGCIAGAVSGWGVGAVVAAGDPVWAVMNVPSLEYAPLAIIVENNKVTIRSFFMDTPLSLEINIKGKPALQVFRIIDVHIIFNADRA
jgi:hypothetical protein